ncbi:polysaccharide deacetylase family protein [Glacieibacterium megasporae]|uniref:polysaccharide deacetylase family protein n=1 Tax=Glacieibacterium megasporae TaxID=2835787 RepID=UPI001C1DDFE1|nr:polysaccharide deacetylase family protein [Polymorphobacter megasporae]UAJ11123.1 polysaccharide deacetylase family protein [Polymorphobacter megasporae]
MSKRALIALILLAASPVHAGSVALTFDDLPVFGRTKPVADGAAITRKLLAGLQANHIHAIGFVNESQLEDDPAGRTALLARWLDAGMDLGNHTFSHPSLDTLPVDDYIADAAKGDAVTRVLDAAHGNVPRWFRFPFLETGPTLAIRDRFAAWLRSDGYRVAPVTMENSDDIFAMVYDEDIGRGDKRAARKVRREYIAFSRRIIPWYRSAARMLLDREPAYVFLLHASRLNADSIGALAGILRHEHLRPVSLDTAMTDPAYSLPDTYAGPNGDDWLERWAYTQKKDLPWDVLPVPPGGISLEAARLDSGPAKEP